MTTPPIDGLNVLAHLEAPDAQARVTALRESLEHQTEGLQQLAAAMPISVSTFSSELALELSGLTRALHLHSPAMPVDIQELAPFVRAEWRKTQLWCGDDDWALAATDVELADVFAGSRFVVAKATRILERLAKAEDPRLRHVVFRDITACIADLSLHPAEALPLLITLSQDSDDAIRAKSVRLLAAPWLFSLTNAAARRRLAAIEAALADHVEEVVCAALDAAAALGESRLIQECFADSSASLTARKCALMHLDAAGEEDHIAPMLRLAAEDPFVYAPAAWDALLGMHRRGVFLRAQHLPALLELYDSRDAFNGDELVRVSHLARRELLELLRQVPAGDLRWTGRADILAQSFGTGAHLLLAELLKDCGGSPIVAGPVAGALLDAAATSAEFDACELALPFYDAMPERVLTLLRVKGDDSHATMLLERACHPSCSRALRGALIEVLWTLSADRDALLHMLTTELGPHESTLLRRAKTRQDQRVAKLVAEAPWPERTSDRLKASARLKIYAASGDIDRREELVTEFRTAYRQCLAKALSGDFAAKRVELPELEQQLFIYGRHLVSDGRRVRPWHHISPETGRDFALQVLCEWLRETPDDAVTVALLESVARHTPSGAVLREIEPYWRHRNPGVQRAALEAILASNDEHGLELSISQLSEKASDSRVLVQALRGIAILGADWAAPMAARCLDHPNMSVKKEAALALAGLDAGVHAEAISRKLVHWLSIHDNSGFRIVLRDALANCAGKMQVAWLVLAAEESEEPRTLSLLCDALSGVLRKDTLLRLAREERLPELVDACVSGDTRVADASKAQVAALLHRAFPEAARTDPDEGAVYRLEVHGFSEEDAKAALEELARGDKRANDEALRTLARNNLGQWLGWHIELRDDASTCARCGALLLTASRTLASEEDPHASSLFDVAEELARSLSVQPSSATGDEARRWGKSLLAFVARYVKDARERPRLLRLLRSLGEDAAVDGLQRFRLLRSFGAVRTRADLDSCLRQSARGPSYPAESLTMLREAFAIAPKPDKEDQEEDEAETKLRETAEGWPGLDASTQRAWLAETSASRPIDVPRLPELETLRRRPRQASTRKLETLVQSLQSDDAHEAQKAADRLIALEGANQPRPALLHSYLQGRIKVPDQVHLPLAHLLESWPTESNEHKRAAALVAGLIHQRAPEHAELYRRLIKEWLQRWRDGDEQIVPLLQDAGERLLPFVDAACAKGDRSLVFLLRFRPERFLRHVGVDHPEVQRLLSEVQVREEEPDDSLEDPLKGLDTAGLLALANAKETAKGLAVRAVHALAGSESPTALSALEELAKARRPGVRSAALRAFHRKADKERAMALSFEVLQIETRPDVVLALMRRLAHAHYAPALPLLIESLSHHDTHIRQHAHRAILAWGTHASKALRRAAKKARPDRRPAILALAAELEV